MKYSPPFLLAAIFSLYTTLGKSSDGIIKEFNDYINQSISDANIAGMAVAIVSGDSILFSQGTCCKGSTSKLDPGIVLMLKYR